MINNINNEISFIEIKLLTTEENTFKITGHFSVNYHSDGLAVRGAEVLKHIILVATRAHNYQAVQPFKDIVVFPDDVKETPNGCSGSFNINLIKELSYTGAGDYDIRCSLGNLVSVAVLANVAMNDNKRKVKQLKLPEPMVFGNYGSAVDIWSDSPD